MPSKEHVFSKFESLKTLNVCDITELKAICEELLQMSMETYEDVEKFLAKRDEVDKHVTTEWCESHFLMTTDVADKERSDRYDHMLQSVYPLYQEYSQKLNEKFLAAKVTESLGAPFPLLRRNFNAANELLVPENIKINAEMAKITKEINEIQGKLTAKWRGEEIPLPELGPFEEDPDRAVRKEAYEVGLHAKESVCEIIDEKFEKLLELRQQVAKNAGCKDYVEYRFKEMQRFDWGPKHCFDFHKAVRKHIVPLREKLIEQRKKGLGLETIKPYDIAVDPFGREAVQIYKKGESSNLIDGTEKILSKIDDELLGYFKRMRDNDLYDLESRENKAPGGYMVMYPVQEMASIFYNGAGLAQDLIVFLHELGHCFHYFLGKDIKPYSLQDWTSEVAEAGSMSMEYIGLEHMTEYLTEEQTKRVKEDKLRQITGLFVMAARGDEFQHWVYQNPGHSVQERRDKWEELGNIYYPSIDNSEYAKTSSKVGWQFPHILSMPFYLIDYAISELLALTVWDRYKENPEDGIAKYKAGCSLAGSKTVPEIYDAFGTDLSFGEEKIAPLVKRIEAELGL